MISIILNTWDTSRVQRHMTQQCIASIRKYTDPEYELIIVDNEPTMKFYHEYDVYKPYTYIEVTPKKTVYESYNLGAEAAKGDVLMFIQNDVFVHERTINKLATYLDEYDMAFPQQYPILREDIKKIYELEDGEMAHVGWRDAGLVAITRKAFDKSGGWDGRFKNLLGEKAFYIKCEYAGISWTDRTNALITHIMAGNNLQKETDLYNTEMNFDAELMRKEYDANH